MRKIYNRAESIILRDKYNQKKQMPVLEKELKKFLTGFVEFDESDCSVSTVLTDKLVFTLQIKIKSFKDVNVLND